jgi:hypothetical protein
MFGPDDAFLTTMLALLRRLPIYPMFGHGRTRLQPAYVEKRILIPLPFAAWRALAWTAELLPNPPVTRNQVELMQIDNVCSPGVPGFAELGISPHSVESVLEQTLRSR